jgi:hypothetical protein
LVGADPSRTGCIPAADDVAAAEHDHDAGAAAVNQPKLVADGGELAGVGD